ncbi:uncharacterized protein LOC111393157 [Olea europaea var. sylvestris]|uniref:uncharacterized protein LOC111393157 n=1 Tax=Olea europaea var. sylvestris TaxID=158386 RepID=UPI000C1CD313|nr:uncharacterized protein LOC111393157 [Olea europaea var. sylvestris]
MRYFLGMEVAKSRKGISVLQRKYIHDLLSKTCMLGCKPSDTPIDAGRKPENIGKSVEKERYRRLVGKLIYLSHTRPNIAFSVSVVSQHMHLPKQTHMEAVYKILRYMKGSSGKGLFFKKNERKEVEIFTDANWAGSTEDRRSITGYCSYIWGNLVTWRSKKQNVVAKSSAKAKFRAMAQEICEGLKGGNSHWQKRQERKQIQPPRSKGLRTKVGNGLVKTSANQWHERTRRSFTIPVVILS